MHGGGLPKGDAGDQASSRKAIRRSHAWTNRRQRPYMEGHDEHNEAPVFSDPRNT